MELLTRAKAMRIKGKEISFFAYSNKNTHSYSGSTVIESVTSKGLLTNNGHLMESIPVKCSLSDQVTYRYNSISQSIFFEIVK